MCVNIAHESYSKITRTHTHVRLDARDTFEMNVILLHVEDCRILGGFSFS